MMDASHLHEEIIAILGPGSECHAAGDDIPERPGMTWKNDIWIQETPIPQRNEISEHLRWLCNFIKPHEDFILSWIAQGAKVDLYFSYSCNDDHRGFGIPGELSLAWISLWRYLS
jgi:hypothetical protein